MNTHLDRFISGIRSKQLLILTFIKGSGDSVSRTCVPLDFGPSRRLADNSDRFHVLDLDSPRGVHPAALLPESVTSITETGRLFDPIDHINWDVKQNPWYVSRDWGRFS